VHEVENEAEAECCEAEAENFDLAVTLSPRTEHPWSTDLLSMV